MYKIILGNIVKPFSVEISPEVEKVWNLGNLFPPKNFGLANLAEKIKNIILESV